VIGAQNLVADHLSRIQRSIDDASPIRDDFPDESLLHSLLLPHLGLPTLLIILLLLFFLP